MRERALVVGTAGRVMLGLFVGIVALAAAGGSADAKRDPTRRQEALVLDPPPYMELAQQAIVAGDLGAAIRVLEAARTCWVEHQQKCGFTQADYDSVAGVIYLERGLAQKAVKSLRGVVARQPNRIMAWFYLGQAHLRLSQYRDAAKALSEAAPVGDKIPQYHAMLVRAWKGAREDERARVALAAGLRRFPQDAPLLFEGTTLFQAKGLFLAAHELARRHAAVGGDKADLALLVLAESYRRKGWLRQAITTLEEATLLCGQSNQAVTRLAYAYAEDGQPLSAARLFERLAVENTGLLHAASEQYRLAGHLLAAQRLALRIEDDTTRRAQLAVVYLQMESFDAVVHLLAPVAQARRLDQQGSIRLVYAALRSGRLGLAAKLLGRLQTVGESGDQLRRALASCKARPWSCW
jgi:tetratricopeptide (TPR) repeat protein